MDRKIGGEINEYVYGKQDVSVCVSEYVRVCMRACVYLRIKWERTSQRRANETSTRGQVRPTTDASEFYLIVCLCGGGWAPRRECWVYDFMRSERKVLTGLDSAALSPRNSRLVSAPHIRLSLSLFILVLLLFIILIIFIFILNCFGIIIIYYLGIFIVILVFYPYLSLT